MKSFKERLTEIVQTSYKLLCEKIAGGMIQIDNEASMQLQLAIIMGTIGHFYEFTPEEHFSLKLEYAVKNGNLQTRKSTQNKARIDIYMSLSNDTEKCSVAMEMKYFPKCDGETVTENRLNFLADIENLEAYIRLGMAEIGFFMLYTTNPNYLMDNRSKVKIGNNSMLKDERAESESFIIQGSYNLKWDSIDNKYFLLLPIHSIQ